MKLVNLDIDDLYLQSLTGDMQGPHELGILTAHLGDNLLIGVSNTVVFGSPSGWDLVENEDLYSNRFSLLTYKGKPFVADASISDDEDVLLFVTLRDNSLQKAMSVPFITSDGELKVIAAGYYTYNEGYAEVNLVVHVNSSSLYKLEGVVYSCFSDRVTDPENVKFVSLSDLTCKSMTA
jgi:hypothetical protein